MAIKQPNNTATPALALADRGSGVQIAVNGIALARSEETEERAKSVEYFHPYAYILPAS